MNDNVTKSYMLHDEIAKKGLGATLTDDLTFAYAGSGDIWAIRASHDGFWFVTFKYNGQGKRLAKFDGRQEPPTGVMMTRLTVRWLDYDNVTWLEEAHVRWVSAVDAFNQAKVDSLRTIMVEEMWLNSRKISEKKLFTSYNPSNG